MRLTVSRGTHDAMVLAHTRVRLDLDGTTHMDGLLLQAVCEHESGDTSFAARYEPHLTRAGWYKAAVDRFGLDVGDWRTFASAGPMQLLTVNAYDLGFGGTVDELFGDPEYSIRYGALHLYRQVSRYGGDVAKALSAYNAGSNTERNADSYVKPIMARYSELSQERGT